MTARELAALVTRLSGPLSLFARQWSAHPEDVVQESFAAMARCRPDPLNPTAWLYRAVRNRAIDDGKSTRRRRVREEAAARPDCWFEESEIDGLDAESAVSALQALPGELREVITARLWSDLTLEQIAELVGCSVSTCHRRFESGIAVLREKLGVVCPKT